jgi:hypothetical protein
MQQANITEPPKLLQPFVSNTFFPSVREKIPAISTFFKDIFVDKNQPPTNANSNNMGFVNSNNSI